MNEEVDSSQADVMAHLYAMNCWTVIDHLFVEWHKLPPMVYPAYDQKKLIQSFVEKGVSVPDYHSPA